MMSRFLTLEEYLERFVDENTRAAGEDTTLIVTEKQAQTLGFFFLNGIAGIVECAKLERGMSPAIPGDDERATNEDSDHLEFLN
jgi:hypothetical protein